MSEQTNFYWGNLLHLGCNMWTENGNTRGREHRSNSNAFTELHFHRELWDRHMLELKESGVNLLLISIGYNPGGTAPIFTQGELTAASYFVDPIPQALTLTSIVIGACVTAMSLALVIKLYESYGTLDTREIRRLRG